MTDLSLKRLDNGKMPEYWINFWNDHFGSPSAGVTLEDVNKALKPFGAKLIRDVNGGLGNFKRTLQFTNDEDAVRFVLKYS